MFVYRKTHTRTSILVLSTFVIGLNLCMHFCKCYAFFTCPRHNLYLKSVNLEAHLCSPSGSLPNKEERMVKNIFASSESYSEATIWAVIVDAFSRLTSKTK